MLISLRFIRENLIALLVSIALIFFSKPVLATSTLSDFSYLHGVDTVVVNEETLPERILLPKENSAAQNYSKIYSTVKGIFADQPWIKVVSQSDITYMERVKPNVLVLNYGVSAQNDSAAKEEIKVGSIAMTQTKQDKAVGTRLTLTPVSFPFVISDERDEFDRKIAEGVHYLTGYLPSYFACANKRGECLPAHPFQEKIKASCSMSALGQKIPVPCSNE